MSWAASDIADWWDQEHRQSKKFVDQFVDENPNLFGVIVGTALVTAMEVGGGFVDVLRFGEGLAEGGISGFGKDALRLLGLAGPAGKVAKFAFIGKHARLARVIVDRGGPICGWIASTIAATRTGARIFASVDDLLKTVPAGLQALSDAGSLLKYANVLRHIGARTGNLTRVASIGDIARMLKADGSVVMFSVAGMRDGKAIGHVLVAFKNAFGRLQIMNRGGKGNVPRIFDTLDEVSSAHYLDKTFQVMEAIHIENVSVKIVDGVAELAMAIYFTTTAMTPAQNETIVQAYTVQKTMIRAGPNANVLEALKARYHTVVSGDWLSKVARRYYGDMYKWPVIYVANRKVIGNDPDRIKPGQRLMIPELPKVARSGTMY